MRSPSLSLSVQRAQNLKGVTFWKHLSGMRISPAGSVSAACLVAATRAEHVSSPSRFREEGRVPRDVCMGHREQECSSLERRNTQTEDTVAFQSVRRLLHVHEIECMPASDVFLPMSPGFLVRDIALHWRGDHALLSSYSLRDSIRRILVNSRRASFLCLRSKPISQV